MNVTNLILKLIEKLFPKTVDGALASLNKAAANLGKVAAKKRADEQRYTERAAKALSKANAAQREAKRADGVQEKLAALTS